jgi:protein SCO1/2
VKVLALASAVLAAVAVAVSVALVASRSTPAGSQSNRYRGIEEPRGIAMPAFSLWSYRGQRVRSADYRGKVVVLTFLDTNCEDACPVVAGVVAESVRALSPSERQEVVAVAITSNPRVDTPAAIRTFLRRRHAVGALDYLIGPIPSLGLVWRSFQVLSSFQSGDPDVHSAPVRIYSRGGEWLATEHAGVDLSAANLAHDVRVALRR